MPSPSKHFLAPQELLKQQSASNAVIHYTDCDLVCARMPFAGASDGSPAQRRLKTSMAVLPITLSKTSGSKSKARYLANSTCTLLGRSAPIITRSGPIVEIIHRMSSPKHHDVSR